MKKNPLKSQQITVKVNEENPEPIELIAKSIIDISNSFQRINESRLKRRVIILLLEDMTGVSITSINKILDAAPKLKDVYIKEIKK